MHKQSEQSQSQLTIEFGLIEKNYWRDLWTFRELCWMLAWRDLTVRYKQTLIGIGWALIQPILTMIIFTLIFGRIANLPSEGQAPYALMVFAGLIPWQFFSASLLSTSGSLLANSNLLSKVYFPRLLVPLAAIAVPITDLIITLFFLIGLMFWYQFTPSWTMLSLPFFIVIAFFASIGPGLWITSLNVKYRDFRYIIPFVIQFGLYVSPVGFSSSLIPPEWRLVYYLNPSVGIIDGFRWAILGKETDLKFPHLLLNMCVIMVFVWYGLRSFRKVEKQISDLL
jgi:lipopolysaccharide transport system permease protein